VEPEIRKFVTFDEETLIEGFRKAVSGLRRRRNNDNGVKVILSAARF